MRSAQCAITLAAALWLNGCKLVSPLDEEQTGHAPGNANANGGNASGGSPAMGNDPSNLSVEEAIVGLWTNTPAPCAETSDVEYHLAFCSTKKFVGVYQGIQFGQPVALILEGDYSLADEQLTGIYTATLVQPEASAGAHVAGSKTLTYDAANDQLMLLGSECDAGWVLTRENTVTDQDCEFTTISCASEGDGVCDVPELCPTGTDTEDCSCPYEGDGACDVPAICPDGTDLADCTTCRWENDGECDAPILCPEGTDLDDCATPTCDSEDNGICDVPLLCPEGTDVRDCNPCVNFPFTDEGYSCASNLSQNLPADRLYLCSGQTTVSWVTCAEGCYAAPVGSPDYCVDEDPCSNLPFNTVVCGANLSPRADPNILYSCENQLTTSSETCAAGCQVTAKSDAEPDYCNLENR